MTLQVPFRVIDVHEAIAGTCLVVMLVRLLLQRVRHVETTTEGPDTERREPRREGRIGERACEMCGHEMRVEDVDCARVKVRGEEEVAGAVARERQPFVDRTC